MKRGAEKFVGHAWFTIFLLIAAIGFAQTTATITGTVTDQSGAIVPNANVTITSVGTGQSRTLTTNEVGRYYATALNPSGYQVGASAAGFGQTVRSGITLTVGSEAVINITLQPGQVTERIEVSAEAPLVQTTNSSVAGLVDSQTIRALPLNGRSFDQLIYLEPGVNVATAAGGDVNQGRGKKFSANGARLTSNYFMLDGTDINDSQNFTPSGAGGQLFGVESILEFQVLTHNPPAQYGRSMGGIINAVTRSGTNSLHGSAYEFLRNSKLDAKNFFDSVNDPIPPFKRNQFGATGGGPIRRDRAFIFANYEGLRERLGVTKNALVPDNEARQGRLPGDPPLNVNPTVVPYLNLYPLPNGPSTGGGVAQFRFSQTQPTRVDYGSARFDWTVSGKDSFFARYTIDDSEKLRLDDPDEILGLFANQEPHRNQYVTLSATRIFSSSVLNSLRFGFNRSGLVETLAALADVPASLSFIPGQQFGRMRILGGVSPCCATGSVPKVFFLNSFQPSDDLTITRGAHVLKTGFLLERFQWNTLNPQSPGGDYQFGSLASFLQGTPDSVNVPFPGTEASRGIRSILLGVYTQDDWRLTRRLTLNVGLRYEITTVPIEVNGKMSFLESPLDTVLKNQPPFEGNHLNFAPRIGFAWDVAGNGKMSLRGGWGIYYDQILMNQFLNFFDRQPPQFLSVTLQGPGTPFPHPLSAALSSPQISPSIIVRKDFKTPYSYQYNLTLQREVARNVAISAGYVGSIGKHLVQRGEGNSPIPTVLADGTLFIPAGAPRRNRTFGPLQTRTLNGFSTYSALQLSVAHRMSRGLQAQAVYTWARSVDTSGGLFGTEASNTSTSAQIPDRIFNDKGLSNFDIRHNAVINLNYALPFGSNFGKVLKPALAGWEIGGIVTLSKGVPFTVENSGNRSRDLSTGNSFSDRPNLLPGATNNPNSGVSKGCAFVNSAFPAGTRLGTPAHYFDPCSFVPQPLGFFGNLGRNTVIGPGISEFDFLMSKHFEIKEGQELQFRAEFFNLANHPNFSSPAVRQIFDNNGRLNGNAGTITQTTTSSRQIQFGLKYTF